MTTDKKQVRILLEILKQKGVEEFVISPGSRNAPIVIGVARDKSFKNRVVIDERSAAFTALGLSAQTQKPVAIVCTSGTAVLNYAPAIAEAYYRNIPLIVITADREPEMIDQNDSQTIRQKNVYSNYIKHSCCIPTNITNHSDECYTITTINNAINIALTPEMGPVHINVPLSEPLANLEPKRDIEIEADPLPEQQKKLTDEQTADISKRVSSYEKVMLLASFSQPDAQLNTLLSQIANLPQVALLTETISNLQVDGAVKCIDRTLTQITPQNTSEAVPQLLITFGGSLISKMVKVFLRTNKPIEHIHISQSKNKIDTFSALTQQVDVTAATFFKSVVANVKPNNNSTYNKFWQKLSVDAATKKSNYVASAEWSDLKAFAEILPAIPADTCLQLSNGTPIRYAQLFDNYNYITSSSNRGVSGIDGATSTAVGASWGTDKMVLLITGDMGFQYDSNALSIADIPDNLKIIVMKNGGGGIFRFLKGTSSLPELERYFECVTDVKVKEYAEIYGFEFYSATNQAELKEFLPKLFSSTKKAILEVVTPRTQNDIILRNYFKD